MSERATPGGPRVLHVTHLTTGRVAELVRHYAEEQVASGLEVAVASPATGSLSLDVQSAGARSLHWHATRRPEPSAAEARELRRIATRWEPDIVHLHTAKAGVAGRGVVPRNRPTVFQPHVWSFDGVSGADYRRAARRDRLAAKAADVVVCASQSEKARGVGAGVLGTPITIIPHLVDLRRFYPKERTQARIELGLPLAVPMAVCVGPLTQQKGQDLLLACWPRVRDAIPEARLVLVGEGPAEHRLRAVATPGVRFVRSTDQVQDWYAAADVVVVPSRWEATAWVPLEAEATGRPVVTANVGGVVESLSPASTIVNPGDVRGMAAAIVRSMSAGWGPEDVYRVRTFAESRSGGAPRVLDTYRRLLRKLRMS
ncbi:glycosyltransferase family 4 protein [Ornithinimicrobium sp. F0845]|uniref:glycosyltransferase family 4 protein n=1 Tax=Ornithinimicrobium sp. F0845 TaxID=2926412 RepID=UPI001FF6DFFC|nr:glycosyltransferase family 4 protein [Ornithinimicrobium sp. F0845]MCK0113414.1 glycosyltransferase family 4 protein [Ornithinimicrobium sp. F0845]